MSLVWELINNNESGGGHTFHSFTFRAPFEGGWLVKEVLLGPGGTTVALTFVEPLQRAEEAPREAARVGEPAPCELCHMVGGHRPWCQPSDGRELSREARVIDVKNGGER